MTEKVLIFAFFIAVALLFSCTSDIESSEEILERMRNSSSSEQGVSSSDFSPPNDFAVLCDFGGGVCTEISAEECLASSGRAVKFCPEYGSSSSLDAGVSSSSSVDPGSSSEGAPSSSSVETDNYPSSSSNAPSSSSDAPSSPSDEPSSSSVEPSSSSIPLSSSSAGSYELKKDDDRITIPNEAIVIEIDLPYGWKTGSSASFFCVVDRGNGDGYGNGGVSGTIGTGASAVAMSGSDYATVQIPLAWTVDKYSLQVDLKCNNSCRCGVSW